MDGTDFIPSTADMGGKYLQYWKSEEIKLALLSQAQFNETFQKSWAIPTLIGQGLMQVI